MAETLGMAKTTREKRAQDRIPTSINLYKTPRMGGDC